MNKQIYTQLEQQAKELSTTHLVDLFAKDKQRRAKFSVKCVDLWLNYSRNHINEAVVSNLIALANSAKLSDKIAALFNGDTLNQSESRSVMHTLLRAPLDVERKESVAVHQQLAKMDELAQQLRANTLDCGNKITDVVCIGIGGSEIGSKAIHRCLSYSLPTAVNLHFVANIDGSAANVIRERLIAKNCLFLITSKTFTTYETTQNFSTLKSWALKSIPEQQFMKHCYAITARADVARSAGFADSHIFEFWDWVGGRFSVWSSVGLPLVLAYGMDVFKQLLSGAYQIDKHISSTSFEENLPVLLALVHIWQTNFMHYHTRAVIPYAQSLSKLPTYLQQLEMESLGKSVDTQGNPLDYATSPIIWGSAGSNGQHAFFQLLHQGSQIVPVDFIASLHPEHDMVSHHNALLANCLAQSQSLMTGGEINKAEHGKFNGNRPSNFILMDSITPYVLGQLLAVYEHKVFVQSVIWQINAFDQWGVELGKQIASQILDSAQDIPFSFEHIKRSFD